MLDKELILQKYEDSQVHNFKIDGFEIEEQIKLPGHAWNISAIKFNQNGLYLASASWDRRVLIWNLKTLDNPGILENEHTNPVTCISWFPHFDSMLVSGSADNSLVIWNIDNNEAVARLCEHESWVLSTSFTDDGNNLVSSSWNGDAIVWDMTSITPLTQLNGHLEGVWCSEFNPVNSKILCTASEDATLRLWDLRDDNQWHSDVILSGVHRHAIKCCSWSPCGNYIAAGSKDGKISIWDIRVNKAINCLFGQSGAVMDVSFLSSALLFSVGDTQCCAWNVFEPHGKSICSLQQHSWSYEVECIALSPDNTLLATGSVDRNITLSTIEVSQDFFKQLQPYDTGSLPYAKIPAKNTSSIKIKEPLKRKSSADILDNAVHLNIAKDKEFDETVSKQTVRIKAPVTSELLQDKLNLLKTVDAAMNKKRESVLDLFRQKSLRVHTHTNQTSVSGGNSCTTTQAYKSKELIEEGKKLSKYSATAPPPLSSSSEKPGNESDFMRELVGKFSNAQGGGGGNIDDVANSEEEEEEYDDDSLGYDIENVTSEMIRITVEEENKSKYDITY